MKSLFLINRSFTQEKLNECLSIMSDQDLLLFIEDGVNNLLNHNLSFNKQCKAFLPDMVLRGIPNTVHSLPIVNNYQEWVDLCIDFDKAISWK